MANDAPAILTSQENAKRTLQIKVVADDSAMSITIVYWYHQQLLRAFIRLPFRMKIGS
jgi:hypothetical protein